MIRWKLRQSFLAQRVILPGLLGSVLALLLFAGMPLKAAFAADASSGATNDAIRPTNDDDDAAITVDDDDDGDGPLAAGGHSAGGAGTSASAGGHSPDGASDSPGSVTHDGASASGSPDSLGNVSPDDDGGPVEDTRDHGSSPGVQPSIEDGRPVEDTRGEAVQPAIGQPDGGVPGVSEALPVTVKPASASGPAVLPAVLPDTGSAGPARDAKDWAGLAGVSLFALAIGLLPAALRLRSRGR